MRQPTSVFERPRPLALSHSGARSHPARWRSPGPAPRTVNTFAALAGVGFGAVMGLGVSAQSWSGEHAPGFLLTAAGRLAGLAGTYAILLVVVLAGRVPWVERTVGQDRLTRWHRRLAPWSLTLIVAHVVLITLGYAQAAHAGALHQFWTFLTSYPGMLAATVGFVALLVAGFTSVRIARQRMKYETWWAVHLYTYLALALSFSHQLATGVEFVGHPASRALWTALWLATAGAVVVWRILVPVWRTAFHHLRVVSVTAAGPGVVSVLVKGRRLDRLRVSGGQFFQWRILSRGLWWQAHPYSLSAVPAPPYMRFTVKARGDHSSLLGGLKPGTRLAVEGPYGAFTADARQTDKVCLIGAGIGITPLRALAEDLPAQVDAAMLVRARTVEGLPLRDELRHIMTARGGECHELIGSRSSVPMSAQALSELVTDIAERDVFICGPTGFTASVCEAARALGIPAERIHHETFAF